MTSPKCWGGCPPQDFGEDMTSLKCQGGRPSQDFREDMTSQKCQGGRPPQDFKEDMTSPKCRGGRLPEMLGKTGKTCYRVQGRASQRLNVMSNLSNQDLELPPRHP